MTEERKKQLKKHEQWLFTLKILTVVCLIGTIVCAYLFIQQKMEFAPAILFALGTIMFFMANKEKSSEAKPGSPEYEAIEHAKAAKQAQNRERAYRSAHPFMVARELVEDNKAAVKKADKQEAALKKAKKQEDSDTDHTAAAVASESTAQAVDVSGDRKFPVKAKAKAADKQASPEITKNTEASAISEAAAITETTDDSEDMDTSIFEDI